MVQTTFMSGCILAKLIHRLRQCLHFEGVVSVGDEGDDARRLLLLRVRRGAQLLERRVNGCDLRSGLRAGAAHAAASKKTTMLPAMSTERQIGFSYSCLLSVLPSVGFGLARRGRAEAVDFNHTTAIPVFPCGTSRGPVIRREVPGVTVPALFPCEAGRGLPVRRNSPAPGRQCIDDVCASLAVLTRLVIGAGPIPQIVRHFLTRSVEEVGKILNGQVGLAKLQVRQAAEVVEVGKPLAGVQQTRCNGRSRLACRHDTGASPRLDVDVVGRLHGKPAGKDHRGGQKDAGCHAQPARVDRSAPPHGFLGPVARGHDPEQRGQQQDEAEWMDGAVQPMPDGEVGLGRGHVERERHQDQPHPAQQPGCARPGRRFVTHPERVEHEPGVRAGHQSQRAQPDQRRADHRGRVDGQGQIPRGSTPPGSPAP